jgi:hypothetical protein
MPNSYVLGLVNMSDLSDMGLETMLDPRRLGLTTMLDASKHADPCWLGLASEPDARPNQVGSSNHVS